MSFATLCDSIYSLISILIMLFSSSNIASAIALHSSVFPTPVCPINRNEPIGFLLSWSPTRARLIALLTALTASSCPITRLCKIFSRLISFSLSVSVIFVTSIPVHFDTTSAISFAPIELVLFVFSYFSLSDCNSFESTSIWFWILAAFS